MYLLFPGRHQLLTNFQFQYLQSLTMESEEAIDINGKSLRTKGRIEAIIFAVTSANHSNTRRNPLSFYLRALAIHEFARTLPVPAYIYGIDDVGSLSSFASYTLKRIKHESEGLFELNPSNTLVICSTPVLTMYEQLGFTILPAELVNRETWQHSTALPWDIVEKIVRADSWANDDEITTKMHPAALDLWKKYKLPDGRVTSNHI